MRGLVKDLIENLLTPALQALDTDAELPAPEIERTRDPRHGHFSTNLAMQLAKPLRRAPRDIAADLVATLPASPLVADVGVAGPGFINFTLAPAAFHAVLREVLDKAAAFGCCDAGRGQPVLLEYVSANPTGPLHVGHGRHAAYGACLASLYRATGHAVHREYYVNDAGRQMDILALSAWLRWLDAQGHAVPFPTHAYQGDYILPISAELGSLQPTLPGSLPAGLFAGLPDDGDAQLDELIRRAREALGDAGFAGVHQHVLNAILADIRDDLAEFGVEYDEWFSEASLTTTGDVERALQRLADHDVTYERDGAVWFRATDYGDEKDRVVVRDNGRTTYFASDIAYHLNKRRRGYERLINIWGADHHGYVPRVRAGMTAMGEDATSLHVELVQFVALYRGGEKAQMSTRSGEFVTLRELRAEVGNDAARLFFVMRSNEQHLDFDLDLAKSTSNDNPVHYLQYAHARVCSVLDKLAERGFERPPHSADTDLSQLTESHEAALLLTLSRFPETVLAAANQHAPQHVVHYLKELAQEFHAYYNAHKFIVDDSELRNARVTLVLGIRQVMRNGLDLLGVSAPDRM